MASEVGDNTKFYGDAKEYWSNVEPTVDGMLGGFSHISNTDLAGSAAFVREFIKGKDARVQPNRALDCGAGIGRITKRLLLNLFKTVDMVELNQKFLDQAPEFLGTELASRVERRICCGLQDFQPEPQRYDVIWCQWVLGHLTDDDLVTFFKRCQSGLSKKGIIIVKENVNASGKVDFDEDDSSYTRPLGVLVDLIRRAGLTVHKQKKQTGFPIGLYEVHMFALS